MPAVIAFGLSRRLHAAYNGCMGSELLLPNGNFDIDEDEDATPARPTPSRLDYS